VKNDFKKRCRDTAPKGETIMELLKTIVGLFLLLALSSSAGLLGSDVQPVDLRCEYLKDPMGVDVAKPRLSWRIQKLEYRIQNEESGNTRSVRQAAYRILVATGEKLLKEGKADLWESGRVESDESVHEIGAAVLEVGSGSYRFQGEP
jgi:alpha-L-rhamnosidase